MDELQAVWVSYPLKQGLKPSLKKQTDRLRHRLSQLSIKTRIETSITISGSFFATSTVWVSYPLKQGLKPAEKQLLRKALTVWVSYPLKQGLKLTECHQRLPFRFVWVSYPLKQGLKPSFDEVSSICAPSLSQLSIKTRIETRRPRNPRQKTEGLSQLSIKTRIETHPGFAVPYPTCFCLSQLSIKTRIETPFQSPPNVFTTSLSQLSIKTRIETTLPQAIWHRFREFESAIH